MIEIDQERGQGSRCPNLAEVEELVYRKRMTPDTIVCGEKPTDNAAHD
jgi:hypothetical protein